jgi:hypothetical protein
MSLPTTHSFIIPSETQGKYYLYEAATGRLRRCNSEGLLFRSGEFCLPIRDSASGSYAAGVLQPVVVQAEAFFDPLYQYEFYQAILRIFGQLSKHRLVSCGMATKNKQTMWDYALDRDGDIRRPSADWGPV